MTEKKVALIETNYMSGEPKVDIAVFDDNEKGRLSLFESEYIHIDLDDDWRESGDEKLVAFISGDTDTYSWYEPGDWDDDTGQDVTLMSVEKYRYFLKKTYENKLTKLDNLLEQ